jgi:hypothetical protein
VGIVYQACAINTVSGSRDIWIVVTKGVCENKPIISKNNSGHFLSLAGENWSQNAVENL